MLTQNVAKATVPSYYMIRTNLPHRKPQNQWEGVYYFSGITKRQRHVILLQRKRERMLALQSYNAHRNHLLGVWEQLAGSWDPSSAASPWVTTTTTTLPTLPGSTGSSSTPPGTAILPFTGSGDGLEKMEQYLSQHPSHWNRVLQFSCQLAHAGLHQEAIQVLRGMEAVATHRSTSPLPGQGSPLSVPHAPMRHGGGEGRPLQATDYLRLLQHFPARRLEECILHTDAGGDPTLTYKLLADRGGNERAQDAYELFELGVSQLRNAATGAGWSGTSFMASTIASQLMNHLMETLLTCGYRHVQGVSSTLYDRMGVLGIAPTATTYQHVITSLALMGDMRAAEDVHRFLCRYAMRDTSSASAGPHAEKGGLNTYQVTTTASSSTLASPVKENIIKSYDALLLGYREAKAFDKCDSIWEELYDRRWPRAAVSTAELYLRSVIDHSLTPVSEPLQRFGHLNVVAKKKVPVILAQMEELGIARGQLSRPLQDEVEDALRKYSLTPARFYEWGRAVKQFDFIEFRRRHGWMYDLHLMKNTTKMMPPVRDPSQDNTALAPAAVAELPAFFNDKHAWEKDPLEELMFVQQEKERVDDVRSGDIYYEERKPLHERSSTWMNEVPETRYDQLYGVSHPDLAKIGIRQHLQGEYANRKELLERDAALMRKTLARGRRLRHRAEVFRTHRQESPGSIPPSSPF